MLVRKQILVSAALDKKIRRLAQKRGISQSALIVAAVEASLDASGQIDHLTPEALRLRQTLGNHIAYDDHRRAQ